MTISSMKEEKSSSSSLCIFLVFSVLFIFSGTTITRTNAVFNDLETITYDEGYSPLFAPFNIKRSEDGRSASLHLNRYAGSGFISSKYYDYGFFSAKIKLPANHTAGIVVAFYTSNADVFEKNHDELDIEFLGNVRGKPWRFQTNVYGNGSTHRGREERYKLWFDASKEFHQYSILWTYNYIIFYVDEVPIREIIRNEEMEGDYPSKPMSLYATIWDASSWATNGGKYGVRYEYEPFVSEFKDFVLHGCAVDPLDQHPSSISSVVDNYDVDYRNDDESSSSSSSNIVREDCEEKKAGLEAADYSYITPERRRSMKWFREQYMYYSYCYDTLRYPIPPPECVIVPSEQVRFKESGRLNFGTIPRSRRPRRKRGSRGRRPVARRTHYNKVVEEPESDIM